MTTPRRIATATTLIITVAVALTACGTTSPQNPNDNSPLPTLDSSPSATPQPSKEPETETGDIPELTPPTFPTATSEQEAIDQAREAIEAFHVATSYLYNAQGKYAERIKDFASGSALAFQEEIIPGMAEQGRTVEGAPKIKDVIYATATKSEKYGEPVEFGYMDMMACGSIAEYRVFDANGKEVEIAPVKEAKVNYAASFQPDTGRWIVEMADVQRQDPTC